TTLAWATHQGLGISTDSVAYLTAASRLLAGDAAGPGPVIRGFPPGYPLLLAAAALVSGDPPSAARGIAVVLLAMNVLPVACPRAEPRPARLDNSAGGAIACSWGDRAAAPHGVDGGRSTVGYTDEGYADETREGPPSAARERVEPALEPLPPI